MNRKRNILSFSLILTGLLFLSHAVEARTVNVTAKAYSQKTGELLFTESHRWTYAGQKPVKVVAVYRDAAGKSLGRRVTDFTKDPRAPHSAPDETFTKPSGFMERIQNRGGTFALSFREKTGSPVKSGSVARGGGLFAGGQGMDNIIVTRWADIEAGKTLRFQFLVPARTTAYGFTMRKVGQATVRGRPALRIRVELSGVLSYIAPALDLFYDAERRHLVRYRGPSNFAAETGEKNIRVEFTRR